MRISVASALVISSIVLLSVPAEAQRNSYKSRDYIACDGYSKPSERNDRLSMPASDRQGGVLYRSITAHGSRGLEACNRVLSDPRVTEIHRVREMNLLTSKALHLSKLQRFDEALVALDQANAVPVEDPSGIIAESIGMRGQFARAYILSETGEIPAAIAILDELAEQRQYSPGVTIAAIDFARSLDLDWERYKQQLTEISRDWPSAAMPLFAAHMIGGEFEQAANIGAIIEFDIPKVRGNWRTDGDSLQTVRQIQRRADIGAARAYALAASGENDASAALMAQVLEEAEAANPGPVDPELRSSRKRGAQEILIAASQGAVTNIGKWQSAIELRQEILKAGKELDDDWLPRASNAPLLVRAELISLLAARASNNPDRRESANNTDGPESADTSDNETTATFAAEGQAAFLKQSSSFSFADLLNRAPSAESESSFPVIRRAGNAIIRVDNGYSRTDSADPRLQTIRYHSGKAGPARVEEIGLLAAALYARHDNKDSIIILTRRSIARSVRYSGNNGAHEGFETQMVVLLTNADEIPEDYAAHAGRVISAATVLAELEPRYDIRESPR